MTTTPTIHLGVPTQAGPLTVFPVWTDAPLPEKALRARLPKGATIDELPDGSEVEYLTVHNPTPKTFLLPGGSIFDGGLQHRALVHSVVVDAHSDLTIDVRCVEQGRWGGRKTQQLHRRRAPLAVRGALRGVSADRVADDPDLVFADQTDVWSRVHRYEASAGRSATSSLERAAEYDRSGDLRDSIIKLQRVLGATHPLPVSRAAHIRRWIDSGEYGRIVGGEYPRREDDRNARVTDDIKAAANSYRESFQQSEDPLVNLVRRFGDGTSDVGGWVGAGAGRLRDWARGGARGPGESGGTGGTTTHGGTAPEAN